VIIKASQRAGAKQLAQHLMNARDNEHVELHELRGFAADDLRGALQEARAVSRGTRCRQYLFSASLNPPEDAQVPRRTFDEGIARVEKELGLTGQPRAVVFHEKDGRRHAHVVWSRIDPERMTAINMAHYKTKLRGVSRDLFLENGWQLPRGLQDRRQRDPLTFTRAEWQQARRAKVEPKALKAMFRECWTASRSAKEFQAALEQRGFYLARGDRRGHVAVDIHGEAYALSRWTGQKARDVRARLGEPERYPDVATVRRGIANRMTNALQGFAREIRADLARKEAAVALRKDWTVQKHRAERKQLRDRQAQRWRAEDAARRAKMPKGLKAVWSWLKGEYRKLRRENERETRECMERDAREKDALLEQHRQEFRGIREELKQARESHSRAMLQLNEDLARYMEMRGDMSGRDPGDLSHDVPDRARGGKDGAGDKSRRPAGPKLEL